MTLAGGGLLGFWTALVTVSFASTIGATLAFLASRFLLRDWVQGRFGDKLKAINEGVEREGSFYLFTLRLVPLFPFFVINLVMGLTPMRAVAYYWVSQIGMLPGTAVYVNAGTQLGQIESAAGILSPGILISFVLLGIFPLIAKRIIDIVKSRKAFDGWDKTEDIRLQPGRHRCRFRWPGLRLYRCSGQSQGRPDRKGQDGRRLPEHRLRAEQGLDPLGQDGLLCQACQGVRLPIRAG